MTQNINWDEFKCRCSGISKIMSNKQGYAPLTENQKARMKELEDKQATEKGITEKQQLELTELKVKQEKGKEIVLSDMCVEYLMEVYAWETEAMIPVNKESMDIMAIKKGRMAELQAGEILAIVDGVIYDQHKDRISNDYLSGEVDFFLGDDIYRATNVTDIKNSFDYPTFLKKINNGLENGQKPQLQGYGDITGAGDLFVANCLVDNPDEILEEMKYRIAKKMNAVTIEGPEFLEEWKKWERSMRFSHISPHKRVFKIKIDPFTAHEQQLVYDRVKVCRDYLWKFDEMYQKMNL